MMGQSPSEALSSPSDGSVAPPDAPPSKDGPPSKSKAAPSTFRLRDGLHVLGIALLMALFLRSCVLEGFRIPTESM